VSEAPEPPAVVFVCARNAVRSPMAEALWRLRFGAESRATSCGVAPASLPDGHMITVMGEKGVDLSGYECRDIADIADAPADLVVCLAQDVADEARAFADKRGAAYALWALEDPAYYAARDRFMALAAFRAARDAIESRILAFDAESGHDHAG